MRPSSDKIVVFLTELEIQSLTALRADKPLKPMHRKAAYKAIRDMNKALWAEQIVTDGQATTLRSIITAYFRSRLS
jgi:hypothetical protein